MTATTAPLLRFITAGSVDDGKSTLIGRLLYDSKTLPPSANKALPLTWPTVILPRPNANSLLPTHRDTSNTRAIWLQAHQLPMPPLF